MNNNNDTVQGVGRLPVIDPDDCLKAVKAKFPNISGWFVQFAEVVTALLDAKDHSMVGHSEPQACQLKALGHGEQCPRDADFILVNCVVTKDSSGTAVPENSRVRYYCAPCVYATSCRAIQSISQAGKLEDVIEEGMAEACGVILEQRAEFVENCIERSAQVVENKYDTDGDAIIDGLRKKFESSN